MDDAQVTELLYQALETEIAIGAARAKQSREELLDA
jgi:hypothetical protein